MKKDERYNIIVHCTNQYDSKRGEKVLYHDLYEAKVGYTCLSQRVRMQVMKDAYLLQTNQVNAVVWEFFRSDITGQVGATQQLLDFLTQNGIQYVIH